MDKPKAGDYARHTRTGGLYRVIKETLAKQADGEWVPSINYVPADGREGDFTRDVEHFRKNFVLVMSAVQAAAPRTVLEDMQRYDISPGGPYEHAEMTAQADGDYVAWSDVVRLLEKPTELETKWAKYLAKQHVEDWACRECYPEGRHLVEGFQCAKHEAAALLRRAESGELK